MKVTRAGRSLEVPCGKPVVVLDQDEVDAGGRRLRLHVHGEAPAVSAPSPFVPQESALGRLARTAAAAAVIGSGLAAPACEVRDHPPEPGPRPIDVRDTPPGPPPAPIDVRDRPPEVEDPHAPEAGATAGQGEQKEAPPAQEKQKETPPIEVRDFPPHEVTAGGDC